MRATERLGALTRRRGSARKGPAPLPPGGGQAVGSEALRARRDALLEQFAELQHDLGGLTYEMAIRDHFRLDVLVRHAARLQDVDAALARAEHLLAVDAAGAAGACPSCGALYARGARFCSDCGTDMHSADPRLQLDHADRADLLTTEGAS